MKLAKAFLLSAALLGVASPAPAQAHDGFGWGFGLGLLFAAPLYASSYYRPYYYPPYGYAPYYGYAPAYAPAYAQPEYVQQAPAPVQQQAYSWYYCPSSNGYYPYVTQCPAGWQKVSPTPPGL